MPVIQVQQNNKTVDYTAEEIGGFILEAARKSVCVRFKVPLSTRIQALITVPDYFNESSRAATITAAKLAGIDVLALISEPTAASIKYGIDKVMI